MSKLTRLIRATKKAGAAARKKNEAATKSGERVITREQAKENVERLKNQEAAKTVQKKVALLRKQL